MMTLACPRWLQLEEIGPVTVVTFATRSVLDMDSVEAVRDQLNGLVDHLGRCELILDLSQVDRLTSLMVARLIGLAKRARAAGGRIAVCGVRPKVREVFDLLQLPRVFPIYDDQQEALESFGVGHKIGA
jgi:anti-anti-sigma factor